jgi:hypothetical protein
MRRSRGEKRLQRIHREEREGREDDAFFASFAYLAVNQFDPAQRKLSSSVWICTMYSYLARPGA